MFLFTGFLGYTLGPLLNLYLSLPNGVALVGQALGLTAGAFIGLSPKAKRFLAVLVVLVFLFIAEPIPLEITAICIGVFIVIMGVGDVKDAWAPYMHS